MKRFWVAIVTIVALSTVSSLHADTYDLVVRNGRIVDGTGNPAYFADVGIKNGRIVKIGRITERSRKEVDAKGLVVAPGFVDVHTHAEGITDLTLGENFVRMGVTTLVLGNCGGSTRDVDGLFKKAEKLKISPNICTLIGHGTVRREVMGGSFMRPPTDEEVAKMRALVEKAMKDGAVGMSTGLIYLPGVFSKTEELIELAKVVSAYDGIYATHQRSESDGIFTSLEEVFRIAREANVRAEISHIKLAGKANWGQTDKVLAAIEKARAEGLDITQDQYSYTASSTGISQLIPESAKDGGRDAFVKRLDDPAQKAKIVSDMKAMLKKRGNDDYSYAVIASYRANRSLNGLNIAEAAKKVRGSDSLDDQIEMIFETERNKGASGVFHGMSDEDVQNFMLHPNTMIASDSGVRRFGSEVPHPRGYGNNARVLGQYVREKNVLRLEDAIRKMTSLPATTFRLKDRGILREGNWADVVIFDPATITDNATYSDPHHYSTGFKYVFVNGVAVVENDKHTEAKPGKALRHSGYKKTSTVAAREPRAGFKD
ncbi:MAG: D-aminoacylase [Verrucomicrobia bacterium]|nr:D-aminoacylase [Verrucomicrobiota bacterium]